MINQLVKLEGQPNENPSNELVLAAEQAIIANRNLRVSYEKLIGETNCNDTKSYLHQHIGFLYSSESSLLYKLEKQGLLLVK